MRYAVKDGNTWRTGECTEDDAGLVCGGQRLPRKTCGESWFIIDAMEPEQASYEIALHRTGHSNHPDEIDRLSFGYGQGKYSLMAVEQP